MQSKRLSVLGVGLLGGSLGLAVKSLSKSCIVVGYGHRRSTLDSALSSGVIDEACDDPAEAVRGADLIVLCTPVGLLQDMLDRIAPAVDPRAIITDVGSTKRSIVAYAGRSKLASQFVGSHPMAGSEKRGVQHAQADLFEDAVCITTPDEQTDRAALESVEHFWGEMGMKVRRLSPDDHDRLIGDVSHLPHALAAALVTMQEDRGLELCGKGFLDSTRIAAGDGGLWRDIFLDNRDNLKAGAKRLQSALQTLIDHLDNGAGESVTRWLDEAARRRRDLGKRD